MGKEQRVEFIDFFRGIGILLMVINHVYFGGVFYNFTHAFHMPMFFIISGFLYSKKSPEQLSTLNLHTTTDKVGAYSNADLVIIATPTNYDDVSHFFDTSAVEDAIEQTLAVNPNVLMVIKSTIPVGYTESVRAKYGIKNIIFSPEFLRESMRYTHHRGLARVTNWVTLKFACMNLKKLATWGWNSSDFFCFFAHFFNSCVIYAVPA